MIGRLNHVVHHRTAILRFEYRPRMHMFVTEFSYELLAYGIADRLLIRVAKPRPRIVAPPCLDASRVSGTGDGPVKPFDREKIKQLDLVTHSLVPRETGNGFPRALKCALV